MAEGLAVAGIVLAVLPIVVSAIDIYKDTALGKDVKRLVASLRVVELIYKTSIEQLLVCLVDSEEERRLLEHPGGPAWQEEALTKKLEAYLDTRCETFLEAINDVKEMIDELHANFNIELRPSKNRLSKFINRFTSKSRSISKLDQLHSKVHGIATFTSQRAKLAESRRGQSTPVKVYERIRDSAIHLYEAFADGWACKCETQHFVNLLLETRKVPPSPSPSPGTKQSNEDGAVHFRFLFSFRSTPALGADESNFENRLWRELEIAPIPHDEAKKTSPEIFDLCAFIRELKHTVRSTRKCLGYLYDKQTQKCHGLFTVVESVADSPRTVSLPLAQILKPSGRQTSQVTISRRKSLSKGARVRLAVVLSSTMLQLHSTPWLESSWSKDEICILEPGHTLKEKKLYLKHSFESRYTRSASIGSTSSGGATLGRTISNTSTIPWVTNETLFSLGIILLELSLGKNIDSRDPETVKRAQREIGNVIGSKYQEAVFSCICCNFSLPEKSMGFHDTGFQQNVQDKVIRPLEECLEDFPYP